MVNLEKLSEKTLRAIIKSQSIKGWGTMSKDQLIEAFKSNMIHLEKIRVKELRALAKLRGDIKNCKTMTKDELIIAFLSVDIEELSVKI